MPSNVDPRFGIDDMINFASRVLTYTDGLSKDIFVADTLRLEATILNLALVGEAATQVPPDVRDLATEIPWRRVIDTATG